MKVYFRKVTACLRDFVWIGFLLWFCVGAGATQPCWGQASAPPASTSQASPSQASATVEDTFYNTLASLSKRYGIAFVAEGIPFPIVKDKLNPLAKQVFIPGEDAGPPSQEERAGVADMVRQVAAHFDYYTVPEGNVYLLIKRYSNPEDMPDVTPEECRNGLRMAQMEIPKAIIVGAEVRGQFSSEPEDFLAGVLNRHGLHAPTDVQWDRLRFDGVPLTELSVGVNMGVSGTSADFYFRTHLNYIAGTLTEMETRPPYNPYFHWKTIDRARVLGYETFKVDFIPISDAQRVVVSPYNATLPRPGFTIRNDFTLPSSDPTDPASLSEQVKWMLDDNWKSSHAISLLQAIKMVNRRAANSEIYDVDKIYARKHVTLIGVESVRPEVLMQSLATVYGLYVGRRGNATVLTTPPSLKISPYHDFDRTLINALPAPIYRALHISIGSPQITDLPPGFPEAPKSNVTMEAYQARGVAMHSMVLRQFRYLAEQRLKPQSSVAMPLSSLGERAEDLFQIARMMRVYADLCGLADCPVPPYIALPGDFVTHTTLYGGYFGEENTGIEYILSLVYSNPTTGEKYGPVRFFDYLIPPTGAKPIEKTTVRKGSQP